MRDDRGVILVNVLVVLAIGSAITVLMFTSQDSLLDRTARAAAGTQAQALASSAETSVVLALQRDMVTAPQTDHFSEPWASAAQQRVELATGSFSVTIDDAQSRFNVNNLARAGVAQPEVFLRLTRGLALPDTVATQVIGHLVRRGPVSALDEIDGLAADTIATLQPYVSALPMETGINLNTADTVVMAAVLSNPAAARRLVRIRAEKGFLTRGDLADVGVTAINGAGFTSQIFDVQSQAEVDGVTSTLTSRILRRTQIGVTEAVVIARRFGL